MISSRARAQHIPGATERNFSGYATLIGLVLWFCFGLDGCARNPVTGRPEPVLTTEQGEIEQGNLLAMQVETKIGLVDDPELVGYIDRLGQKLAAHSPRRNITYRFYVVDVPEPNAFALPGGHIYVSRGLLTLANSEDELAAILGHEIGHVAARHSVRRQTASAPLLPIQLATAIGSAATAIVSPRLGQMVSGAGQWPGAFAMAAYSREQERNADELGQRIAAATGFDPSALARFMHTLALEEELNRDKEARDSFLRSHPPSPERSLDAERYAQTLRQAQNDDPSLSRRAFLDTIAGIVVGESAASGVFIGDRFVHPELGISFDFPAGWQTTNTPQTVSARRLDGRAQILVELVGRGDDPMESALFFNQHVHLDTGPTPIDLAEIPAVQATTQLGERGNRQALLLTWIAYDGLLYRITGATEPQFFETTRPTLELTPRSFHALSSEQQHRVNEDRLRIVITEPTESLEDLGRRSHNSWTVEQTAIANALDPTQTIAPGRSVKISHPEQYRPRPESPPRE